MTHPSLNKARQLFERAEYETSPSRKFSALEEALELVDLILDESELSQAERELATNLQHSNIRRLLTQLIKMRNIQISDWLDYILLLLQRKQEVEIILAEAPSLNDEYRDFAALWKEELLEALGREQERGI